CVYYGAPGWANITGAVKQSKNVIATGALNAYDARMGFSSKGPAYDGRIKPDMCAVGPGGTSHAAPGVAGVIGQLHEAFRSVNGGQEADGGLLKAILQNTAEDLGNAGPDFQFGYGRINARRAWNLIDAGQHLTDSVTNGANRTFSLNVPAGTQEVRVMVYWTDYEATNGAAAALVNDLDFRLIAPGAQTYLPWVLDTAANAASLDAPATRGRDSLNNMEQVTLENPAAGTYTLEVEGRLIPMGPQKFYIVYDFVQPEIVVTHPTGGEGWVPNVNEIIRWDAHGTTGNFMVEYSADSGMTWTVLSSNVPATDRYLDFSPPDTVSGHCFVRVSAGAYSEESAAPFSIIRVPTNLEVLWSCGDSLMLTWDGVQGATDYEVSRLGQKYMDSVGTTSQTHLMLTGMSTTEDEWLSVKALGPLDARGRRAIAIQKMPGDSGCVPFEGEAVTLLRPAPGWYPDCMTSEKLAVTVRIRNNGVSAVSGFPVAYQVGGGPVVSGMVSTTLNPADVHDYTFSDSLDFSMVGSYPLKVWISVPGDTAFQNDTLSHQIDVYASGTVTPSYTQDFDTFTTCNTAWGCESISCTLSQNWFNVPNTPSINGDSIDFRTDANGTGSGGTGPSSDHTSGAGNYLYLEGSGNGGAG
ncbi:MAG: S8 family serine peptidase, partial [Bacteroidota bacterium]